MFSVKGRPGDALSTFSPVTTPLPPSNFRPAGTAGDEGIDVAVDRLGSAHPHLGPDAPHPVREARYEAEVFADMLLADQPYRHDAPGRKDDGRAKEPLQHEDAFGVVAQRAVPKIRRDRLRLVDYVDSHQQSLSATRGSTPIGEVSDGKCQCQTRRQCTRCNGGTGRQLG